MKKIKLLFLLIIFLSCCKAYCFDFNDYNLKIGDVSKNLEAEGGSTDAALIMKSLFIIRAYERGLLYKLYPNKFSFVNKYDDGIVNIKFVEEIILPVAYEVLKKLKKSNFPWEEIEKMRFLIVDPIINNMLDSKNEIIPYSTEDLENFKGEIKTNPTSLNSQEKPFSSIRVSVVFLLNKIRAEGYSFDKLKKDKEQLTKDYLEVIFSSGCYIVGELSQKDKMELLAICKLLNVTEYELNQMQLISELIDEETTRMGQQITNSKKESIVRYLRDKGVLIPEKNNNTRKYKCAKYKEWSICYGIKVEKWEYSIRAEWLSDYRIKNFNQFNEYASYSYLGVKLTATNWAKSSRTLPPIKLVDNEGNEYDPARITGGRGDDKVLYYENVNPSLSVKGWVIFDVPKGEKYRLKLTSGKYSDETAYVDLEL